MKTLIRSSTTWADRLIGRLLWVDIRQRNADDSLVEQAERAFGASVMFSGLRCVLQYAVLPFVLPIIGVAVETTMPLMLAINVLAIVSVFFSLRRFWQIGYQYRWQYLVIALAVLAVLALFMVLDFRTMLTA
jgi:hypothetical protein